MQAHGDVDRSRAQAKTIVRARTAPETLTLPVRIRTNEGFEGSSIFDLSEADDTARLEEIRMVWRVEIFSTR